MRLSVRARLTVIYGGLFLLAGLVLLLVNYVLVESRLPEAPAFAAAQFAPAAGPAYPTVAPDALPDSIAVQRTVALTAATVSAEEYRASALNTLLLQSGVALVVTAALAVGAGWLVAGRVLRPVHDITTTARRLGAESLDRRIGHEGPADELKELADTFDDMLDRLAAAFDSQRRFVANASHELRTPLAVQRTLVEVALADPEATPELRRLATHLLHAGERNERLIEGLLTLARGDRGLDYRTPVRLDELTERVLATAAGEAARQEVTLDSELDPVEVAGDPVLLERLVDNLVRNAVQHNEPGGSVRVEVGTSGLVVTNTGPEVPPAEIPGLFEPFRRGEADRTGGASGVGLGLSIVRSVARAHGAELEAEPGPRGGLRVAVRFGS